MIAHRHRCRQEAARGAGYDPVYAHLRLARYTWAEAEALAVVECRPPDLVISGDSISGCSPAVRRGMTTSSSMLPP